MSATSVTTHPYSNKKRMLYGSFWGFVTLMLFITLFNLPSLVSVLVALVLLYFAGKYTYRIWTWQAKHLVFFIIF